eukprot:6466279-Amphidinium_carterae.1
MSRPPEAGGCSPVSPTSTVSVEFLSRTYPTVEVPHSPPCESVGCSTDHVFEPRSPGVGRIALSPDVGCIPQTPGVGSRDGQATELTLDPSSQILNQWFERILADAGAGADSGHSALPDARCWGERVNMTTSAFEGCAQGDDIGDAVRGEAIREESRHLQSSLPLPWETGLAGLVFGRQPTFPRAAVRSLRPNFDDLACREFQFAPGSQDEVPLPADSIQRPSKVPRLRTRPIGAEADDAKQRGDAMRMIRTILTEEGLQCTLNAMDMDGNAHEFEQTLEDCFARKAARTISIRAGSMLMFIRWCQACEMPAFPLTEA